MEVVELNHDEDGNQAYLFIINSEAQQQSRNVPVDARDPDAVGARDTFPVAIRYQPSDANHSACMLLPCAAVLHRGLKVPFAQRTML
jgi:hypothetical protein